MVALFQPTVTVNAAMFCPPAADMSMTTGTVIRAPGNAEACVPFPARRAMMPCARTGAGQTATMHAQTTAASGTRAKLKRDVIVEARKCFLTDQLRRKHKLVLVCGASSRRKSRLRRNTEAP